LEEEEKEHEELLKTMPQNDIDDQSNQAPKPSEEVYVNVDHPD
jgi:hypothetical protein